MTIPVDGYTPTEVEFFVSVPDMPNGPADFAIRVNVFGLGADRETMMDALDAGVVAIVGHLNTEEPTWNAAITSKLFRGYVQTIVP